MAKVHLHLLIATSFHINYHYTLFANVVKYVAGKNGGPMFNNFFRGKLINCFHFHLLLQSNHVVTL